MVNDKKIILPAEELKKRNVGLVYLFGSRAEGTAGFSSDYDVGIVFTDPTIVRGNTTKIYNELYDIFSETFDLRNFRSIDIVFLERASLELRFDVISHGIVLFEISPAFRVDFEEHVEMLYRDFKPILNEFNQVILERV
ncbi:MAG TPA: nucleotidyltransferase domain-containing protein [Candidatus Paceibacterota bacterium]